MVRPYESELAASLPQGEKKNGRPGALPKPPTGNAGAALVVIFADDDLLLRVARLFLLLDDGLAAVAVDIFLDDGGFLGLYRSRHRHAHDEGGRNDKHDGTHWCVSSLLGRTR